MARSRWLHGVLIAVVTSPLPLLALPVVVTRALPANDDAALRFGVALPFFQDSAFGDETRRAASKVLRTHLSRALVGEDPRPRRNLVATFGVFLLCQSHEELLAAVRKALRDS